MDNALPHARKCFVGFLVAATMVSTNVVAGVTTTVVDVPTRGATQRFLYVRPDAPVANIVFHPEDAPSAPFVDPLFDALNAAPARERIRLVGGSNGDCGGYHLFMGIDAEFVAAVAGFIDKHNTMRR